MYTPVVQEVVQDLLLARLQCTIHAVTYRLLPYNAADPSSTRRGGTSEQGCQARDFFSPRGLNWATSDDALGKYYVVEGVGCRFDRNRCNAC